MFGRASGSATCAGTRPRKSMICGSNPCAAFQLRQRRALGHCIADTAKWYSPMKSWTPPTDGTLLPCRHPQRLTACGLEVRPHPRGRYHADQLLLSGQKLDGNGHRGGRKRRAARCTGPGLPLLAAFSEGPASDLTIEHVLQMRIGIPYGESYKNPFGFMSKCTYGDNIMRPTSRLHRRRARRDAVEIPRGQYTACCKRSSWQSSTCLLGTGSPKRSGDPLVRLPRPNGRWTMPDTSATTPASTPLRPSLPDWASSCWTPGRSRDSGPGARLCAAG